MMEGPMLIAIGIGVYLLYKIMEKPKDKNFNYKNVIWRR